ncbi:MAG: hypothetical protein CVV02_08740 [Firmicutes bacterium HGW-Firmicutes-7]|nr:MAG: hypothetical protein CVV02_08740 [Firmicutes bacterium HGW-Firmicutes-7]
MKQYKIAFLTENPINTLGGVERFTLSLKCYFEKNGFVVKVYDKSIMPKEPKRNWFNSYFSTITDNYNLGNEISKRMKEDQIDFIIQNGLSAWSICRRRRIPRMVIHHGTWREVSKHLSKGSKNIKKTLANKVLIYYINGWFEWFTSKNAISIGVSSSVKNELKSLYYNLDAIAIQNGIDTELFKKLDAKICKKKYGLKEEDFIISFTGRLEYRKGNDILAQLSHKAYKEDPSIKFLFATDQKTNDFADNVIFLEHVNYEEMPYVYCASDLFIMPTRYEGCSYSIIEAMSCNTPILISSVGHGSDISRFGALKNVVLDEINCDVYWEKIIELKNNKGQLKEIGDDAKKYVDANNTLEIFGKAYLDLIKKNILKGRLK